MPVKCRLESDLYKIDFEDELTKIISNSISWSTCMNFWSHSSMSVVFLRESESSSLAAAGSFLWCSHHSITFFKTDSLTCENVSNLNLCPEPRNRQIELKHVR